LGQAIGGDTEGTLIGAGIGALAGGIAGGMIGNYMDRQEQDMRRALAGVEDASIRRDQNVLAVTFKSDLFFDVGSSTIKPGAYEEIDRVARVLNDYPQTRIRIEGHTDSTGSEAYNLELSRRRAEAVRDALIARGVHSARLETVGFGEASPVATNDTESGRQLNRRVNVVIVPIEA
jgi:outer membrane protein OmpA-like peptidoglycan-associated protein